MSKEKEELSILSRGHSEYPSDPTRARIEVFDNPSPSSNYRVQFSTDEFTSLCPVTEQPDFASVKISYSPEGKCIESKSLKLYLFSYRNYKGFGEKIVNLILDDLVKACRPEWMRVDAAFTPRGGVSMKVGAFYPPDKKEEQDDYKGMSK